MSKEEVRLTNVESLVLHELLQHRGLGANQLSTQIHRGWPDDIDSRNDEDYEEPEETTWDMSGPEPAEVKSAIKSLLSHKYIKRDSRRRYHLTKSGGVALLKDDLPSAYLR